MEETLLRGPRPLRGLPESPPEKTFVISLVGNDRSILADYAAPAADHLLVIRMQDLLRQSKLRTAKKPEPRPAWAGLLTIAATMAIPRRSPIRFIDTPIHLGEKQTDFADLQRLSSCECLDS